MNEIRCGSGDEAISATDPTHMHTSLKDGCRPVDADEGVMKAECSKATKSSAMQGIQRLRNVKNTTMKMPAVRFDIHWGHGQRHHQNQ